MGKQEVAPPKFNITSYLPDGGARLLWHGGAVIQAQGDFSDGKTADAVCFIVPKGSVTLTLTEEELGTMLKFLLQHLPQIPLVKFLEGVIGGESR